MPVERYGRRYVIYEGRLYRSATFEIDVETDILMMTLRTWNWAEDWDDVCGLGWEDGVCPVLETEAGEFARAYAEEHLDEILGSMTVVLTFTLRCPYTATKPTNKDVTTLGSVTMEMPLRMLFEELMTVELRSSDIVDVYGGRRGAKYPEFEITSWRLSEDFLGHVYRAAVRYVSTMPSEMIERLKELLEAEAAKQDMALPDAVRKSECYADTATIDVDIEIRMPPERVEVSVEFERCEH